MIERTEPDLKQAFRLSARIQVHAEIQYFIRGAMRLRRQFFQIAAVNNAHDFPSRQEPTGIKNGTPSLP